MTFASHKFRRCIGWSCLTEAQKTGIIVSITVVAVASFLAYMHCLGKAAIARRERASVRLPGGRRAPRARGQRQNTVIAQLPVAHQRPGGPAYVSYQPALFTIHGSHCTTAQPIFAAGPRPCPPPTRSCPAPPNQPHCGHEEASAPNGMCAGSTTQPAPQPAPQSAPDPPTPSFRRPRQRGWLQTTSQALRLPVGRASTIDSESAPGTPRRVGSPETVNRRRPAGQAGVGTELASHGEQDSRSRQSPPAPTGRGGADATEESETSSLQTNVAVVHSDDFQMGDLPSRLAPRLSMLGSQSFWAFIKCTG